MTSTIYILYNQKIVPLSSTGQLIRPKLLKEISDFYNKKIYTTLIHPEGSIEKNN